MAEPLNATFFAFKRRERGGVLTGATIAFAVVGAALIAAFVALFWGPIASLGSWYIQVLGAAAANDMTAIDETTFPMGFFAVLPGMLLWLFFFYVLYAAYEAACLRWMVRGETGGLLGLTLGADTWRVYVGYWVWFGLYLAGSTALSIVMVVLISVFALAGAGLGVDAQAYGVGGVVGGVLLYLAYYAAMAYFAVRFAPAAATSIARRRFSFFDAWTVTKGRFWALFGAFLLLWLIYVVFSAFVGVTGILIVFAQAAPLLMQIFTDPEAFSANGEQLGQAFAAALSNPATWAAFAVWQLIAWIGALTLYLAMFGVNARAAVAALEEGKIKVAAAS